jgi:hypothetical protein
MTDTNPTASDTEPEDGLLKSISNYIHEEKENIGRTSKTLDCMRNWLVTISSRGGRRRREFVVITFRISLRENG